MTDPAIGLRLGRAIDLHRHDLPVGAAGAAELEAPVEGLWEHVRRADSAPIDETSGKQGHDKAWLRGAVTAMATVYTIATSRGAEIAKAMLGTAAGEVVFSDPFQSYAWIKRRRFCWAHLRRDFQAMIDRGGDAGEVGRRLLEHSYVLFAWWHRVREGTLARFSFRSYVAAKRPFIKEDLEGGAACACSRTAWTCPELLAGETHLETFVRAGGIGPTNSDTERALRHGVIDHKISGGTDSEHGSRFVERMLSVEAPCRQQEIDVLEYLTRCYQPIWMADRFLPYFLSPQPLKLIERVLNGYGSPRQAQARNPGQGNESPA